MDFDGESIDEWIDRIKIKPVPRNSIDWLSEFELTDAEAEAIADPEWVYEGMIPESHVVAVVARPNGGKTTILFDIACQLPQQGYHTVFVHADTNPSDAKIMRRRAVQAGVRYLTPDMKVGMSMANVVEKLQALAVSDIDLTDQVWFFDTLKKMADVISKNSLKQLMQLMRKLASRGMTVVLLGHVNKYRDSEGKWKYEGTADLESDSDELIYFEPEENSDGSLTVSTRKQKIRCPFVPMTFQIAPDRSVSRMDEYVDVLSIQNERIQQEENEPVIEVITDAIKDNHFKQSDIIAFAKEKKVSEKRVRRVLKNYTDKLWTEQTGFQRNEKRYHLIQK